jgi:hypothetical protein
MRVTWGRSSAGRASRSQCEGRGFDPLRLHHTQCKGFERSGPFCLRGRRLEKSFDRLRDRFRLLDIGNVCGLEHCGRSTRSRGVDRPAALRRGCRVVRADDDQCRARTRCLHGDASPAALKQAICATGRQQDRPRRAPARSRRARDQRRTRDHARPASGTLLRSGMQYAGAGGDAAAAEHAVSNEGES